jgi:hypothetical protein
MDLMTTLSKRTAMSPYPLIIYQGFPTWLAIFGEVSFGYFDVTKLLI